MSVLGTAAARIVAVLFAVGVLAGCGSWGYNATAVHEAKNNKPGDAVARPPRCFIVQVHKDHLFTSEHEGIGLYCRVAEPFSTTTTTGGAP